MKEILFCTLFSFLSANSGTAQKTDQKKKYFFCDSRAWNSKDFSKKQVIQYTEINEVIDIKDSTGKYSKAWFELAHKQCENASGCTADFNFYPTYADAKVEYDKTLRSYSDTSRYIVKRRKL